MIRIQKLLADAGLGSRRNIEEWIRAGRITVGGRIAQLGDRANLADELCLDGRRLELGPSAPRGTEAELLLYHKPLGEVTTRQDPQGRPTVFERLPELSQGRWINVGRLDVNTAGLLLFTTDGGLAHRLMHPSSEVEREYLVRVRGRPPSAVIRQLQAGVELEDGPARFDRISQDGQARGDEDPSHSTFRVVLHEGRNREVRRLWNAVGFDVSRLLRVRYGPVELPRDLRPGMSRRAEASLVRRLEEAARRLVPRPPRSAGGSAGGPKGGSD
jgi:23S rRNA pseudouridine2605 synthase